MIDVDEVQDHFNGHGIANEEMNEPTMSSYVGSSVNGSVGIPPKRPTRESVLKRLSEALMRHTLTKVRK